MSIWWIVAISVCVVLSAILIFRMHAFLTLLLAGLLVAALSSPQALSQYAQKQVDAGKMTETAAAKFPTKHPASRLATEFGVTAGKIGILIALASVIGQLLLESGAAATIVDRMLKVTGPKFAPEAMAASSFVLGIPVFFDTVFYLMVPLARSLRRRIGKNYVLFILSILAGGSLAHSLIPPTPGPLFVAEELGIGIGTMMIGGMAVCFCGSIFALFAARVINSFVNVPLREEDTGDGQESSEPAEYDPATNPGLLASLMPIVVPVILITTASFFSALSKPDADPSTFAEIVGWLGDKNIAIGIGVVLGLFLMKYVPTEKRETLIGRSLSSAGTIILITAAGGAFGAMLRQAGIAEAVGAMSSDVSAIMILPLAFFVTAAIRTLQGSATVAMITAVGVLQGFVDAGLPYHPVYLALAIGSGSKPVSWMTDSAFWVITRMSGMTESEGLKTLPAMSTSMGIAGLIFTMLFATLFPMAPAP